MAKSKKLAKAREPSPKPPPKPAASPPPKQSHAMRETVESIVIAFVLAFLFRTFEAEAFVIPTGSMAPTLMGRHKDVDCSQCDHRFRVSASEEEGDEVQRLRGALAAAKRELRRLERGGHHREAIELNRRIHQIELQIKGFDIVGGVCPVCRYPMPMRPDLPVEMLRSRPPDDIRRQPSYNGDRILVNKYIYTLRDPERWDVVVFKYPGDAQMNFIKRLVGLPNEVVRIHHGDLFVGPPGASDPADFRIARKPPDKVLAMRQLVHDTNYDPGALHEAGWPLRWQVMPHAAAEGWRVEAESSGNNVRQRYVFEGVDDVEGWLRYHHYVPDAQVWEMLAHAADGRDPDASARLQQLVASPQPSLIMDFNAYNTRVLRSDALSIRSLAPSPAKKGIHWVGDLMVEARVEVHEPRGTLLLDLVKGGRRFMCSIDLASGRATLRAEGDDQYAPTAATSLRSAGSYRVALANFDDQLLLWVDGKRLEFDADTAYDANRVFGDRTQILPQTSAEDPGDLAPVAIGARGASLAVTRLQVWRDIYYIAHSSEQIAERGDRLISDYARPPTLDLLAALPYDPSLWEDTFLDRRHEDFPLNDDQFFVLGDNSAESSDARLWRSGGHDGGRPGGDYLERRLLTGKAICVYWPHSWNRIPGTPIPFPLFPNFADMRLVR